MDITLGELKAYLNCFGDEFRDCEVTISKNPDRIWIVTPDGILVDEIIISTNNT